MHKGKAVKRGRERMIANILYQFDERYAPYAGVSITSLFENNKHIDEINVYILGVKLSEVTSERLVHTSEKYGRNIIFIDTEMLVAEMKRLGIPTYRGSYTANLKLFVSMAVDESIERLLYIDSDTVVAGDIAPMFEMTMDGKPLGMSIDSLGVRHKGLIGLGKNDDYYNTGVMLFDVVQWRREGCTEQIMNHAKNVRAHYMSPDQDLANVVLKSRIYRLGAEYNLQPIHIVYDYKLYDKNFGQPGYYTCNEIDFAVQHPVIIHFFRFLGQFPWDTDSVHPDKDIFDKYLNMSLWNDYVKKESDNNSIVFGIERWLYRHLNKRMFLFIFRLNYDVFMKRAEKKSRNNRNDRKM